ncbi:MAG: hypothetical protein V3S30_09175 [Thermoanaerobaculia bacterium]
MKADTTGVISITTLDQMAQEMAEIDAVYKRDLLPGDWVVVSTKNSVYSILVLESEGYSVSGGWFDIQDSSPMEIEINGCTQGRMAIKHDIVAARGCFLEFGNGVVTTRIRHVKVIRSDTEQPCN